MSDLVDGIPLVALTMAIVEWLKSLNVQGTALRIASMIVGILLGVLYKVAYVGVAITPAAIFGAAVYGLALGLTASGLYDAGKSIGG